MKGYWAYGFAASVLLLIGCDESQSGVPMQDTTPTTQGTENAVPADGDTGTAARTGTDTPTDTSADTQVQPGTDAPPDTDIDTTIDTAAESDTGGTVSPGCEQGIPNATGTICCTASCGRCGGAGCSGLPGGADNCCAGTIANTQRYCADYPPPCIIGAPPDFDTDDSDTGSGTDTDHSLDLLPVAVELGRTMITAHSYSATGVADKDYKYAGAMGGRAVTYRGYQYVVYYEEDGTVTIARRKVDTYPVVWEYAAVVGYTVTTDDRHNKMAIAISKGDGRIHIAFDHHASNEFHYAWSPIGYADDPTGNAWNDGVFTYTENLDRDDWFSGTFVEGTVTYPAFIEVGDNIMLYWRSGGQAQGRMNIGNYDTARHAWTEHRVFTSEKGTYTEGTWSSSKRGPYHAGLILDPSGTLHVAWLWRESGCVQPGIRYCNHGLYYAYTPDLGAHWYASDGSLAAGPGESISVETIEPVWDIGIELDPSNPSLQSRFVPETGAFEVYVTHKDAIGGTSRSTYLYRRAANGQWTKTKVTMTPGGLGVALPANAPPTVPNETWDYSRLRTDGIVTRIYQEEPSVRGASTPLYAIDYRFAE